MLDRADLATVFLHRAGWGAARRAFLAGDASDRRYERLHLGGETAILMDAPPGRGDDPADFLRIGRHLLALGLSAPKIIAEDLTQGFLLLEDLGDDLFARILAKDPGRAPELYASATDVILHLHRNAAPTGLPDLTASAWAEAACLVLDWYVFAITGERPAAADLCAALTDLMQRHADGPRVLILRDFHAENLLWLPDRQGLAKVGLLDFQLGQMGQPAYDLVSMLQDARRDVHPETEAAMKTRFCAATGQEFHAFEAGYATLGAQRALRILGIFGRLCMVGGKAGYVRLMPRVWGQLQQNLRHPALAPLARLCENLLPPPTSENLTRIESQCANFR